MSTEQPVRSRPIIGVGVMVVKGDRALLGKRKNAHGAGSWAFPGGHLEYRESIEECARREVGEECGLEIGDIRPLGFTNDLFHEAGKHYVTLFVRADHRSGQPVVREPDQCELWIWSPWPPEVSPLFLPLANLLKQNIRISF